MSASVIGTPFAVENEEEDLLLTRKEKEAKYKNKFVPIYKQEVRDEKGRKRLHGAWKGGFSAGYFNTVGSEEGWAPSQFISSREKRQQVTQKREDFMDTEDFEDLGLGDELIAQDNFQSINSQQSLLTYKQAQVGAKGSAIPGPIPDELFVTAKTIPIGQRLLKLMGWREGQGIGPRIKQRRKKRKFTSAPTEENNSDDDYDPHAVGFSFAPQDVAIIDYAYKDNVYGIGYDPYNEAPEFRHARSTLMNSKQNRMSMGMVSTPKVSSLFSQHQRKELGFGVGLFEDSDDIEVYDDESSLRTQYDTELVDKKITRDPFSQSVSTTTANNNAESALGGYIAAKKLPPRMEEFLPPEIPRDFNPHHVFTEPGPNANNSADPSLEQIPQYMREQLMREKVKSESNNNLTQEPPSGYGAMVDMLSPAARKRLEQATGIKLTSSTPAPAEVKKEDLPFSDNPEKQKRYKLWLKEQIGEAEPGSTNWSKGLDERQTKRENDDFMRSWGKFKPSSSTVLASRFVSTTVQYDPDALSDDEQEPNNEYQVEDYHSKAAELGMFGALTRTIDDWQPAPLLCKRFNIANPRRKKRDQRERDRERQREEAEFLWRQQMQDVITLKEERKQKDQNQINSNTSNEEVEVEQMSELENEQQEIEPVNITEDESERPPIDLFKAIFASSEESDSEDEDEHEHEPEPTITTINEEPVVTETKSENHGPATYLQKFARVAPTIANTEKSDDEKSEDNAKDTNDLKAPAITQDSTQQKSWYTIIHTETPKIEKKPKKDKDKKKKKKSKSKKSKKKHRHESKSKHKSEKTKSKKRKREKSKDDEKHHKKKKSRH